MSKLAHVSILVALALTFGCSDKAQAEAKAKAKVVDGHIDRPESWPPYFDCDLVRKPYTWFHADGSGSSLGEARGIARLARRGMQKRFGVDDGVLFRCRGGELPETNAKRHRGDCQENIGAYADTTPKAADKTCSLDQASVEDLPQPPGLVRPVPRRVFRREAGDAVQAGARRRPGARRAQAGDLRVHRQVHAPV